jgi:hypothetical protein
MWLILFNVKKVKIFNKFINRGLSEYKDDDIIPEEITKKNWNDSVAWAFRIILVNTVIPCCMIICGILVAFICNKYT